MSVVTPSVYLEPLVLKDFLETPDFLVEKVVQAFQEILVYLDLLDSVDRRASLESQAVQDRRVPQGSLAAKVLEGSQDPEDRKGHQVFQELQALLARKVYLALQVLMV